MSYAKIRPRRGTAYEWNTENPILHEGEFVLEVPDSGVGTGLSKFKVGDGVTPYRDLPYAFDGAAASAILGGTVDAFHLIQLRAGTAEQWETVNPILEANEIAYDSTNHSLKVGDGIRHWNDLTFINSASGMETVWDFGEETEEVAAAFSFRRTSEVEEPVEISDGTATIADLIPESDESNDKTVIEETITETEEEIIDESVEENEEDDPLA